MSLQSKMIEEWSRENAMIKVSVLCYMHFFQESIAGLNPILKYTACQLKERLEGQLTSLESTSG